MDKLHECDMEAFGILYRGNDRYPRKLIVIKDGETGRG